VDVYDKDMQLEVSVLPFDNAGVPSSAEEDFLNYSGPHLLRFPTCIPFLRPIEGVFWEVNKHIKDLLSENSAYLRQPPQVLADPTAWLTNAQIYGQLVRCSDRDAGGLGIVFHFCHALCNLVPISCDWAHMRADLPICHPCDRNCCSRPGVGTGSRSRNGNILHRSADSIISRAATDRDQKAEAARRRRARTSQAADSEDATYRQWPYKLASSPAARIQKDVMRSHLVPALLPLFAP